MVNATQKANYKTVAYTKRFRRTPSASSMRAGRI